MNSFKWGIIAAIAAFGVSVLMGIIFRVSISHILLRAILFTVVFFGLGFGLRFAINSFFPDIFNPESGVNNEDDYGQAEDEQAGARINIVMDNTGEYAVPELYKAPDNPNEMGNIEALAFSGNKPRSGNRNYSASAKGIDADKEEGYNTTGGSRDFSSGTTDEISLMDSGQEGPADEDTADDKPVFTPSFGEDSGVGGLPDLDMMSRAFSGTGPAPSAPASSSSSSSMPIADVEEMEPAGKARNTGNKPEPLKGDFTPKELAEGIRSVLGKDK